MLEDQTKILQKHFEEQDRLKRTYGIDLHRLASPIQAFSAQYNDWIGQIASQQMRFIQRSAITANIPSFGASLAMHHVEAFRESGVLNDIVRTAVQGIANMSKNFYDSAKIVESWRKHLDLTNSSFGTAIYASSLRQHELDALRTNLLAGIAVTQFDFQKSLNFAFTNSKAFAELLGSIDTFQESFAGRLAAQMRLAIENTTNGDEAFNRIDEIVDENLANTRHSGFTKFELISMILAIFALMMAAYQMYDSNNTAAAQKLYFERLIKIGERIANSSEEEVDLDGEDTYYAVERIAEMKMSPTFKSVTVGILNPKERVHLVSRKHKWIFIESLNVFNGHPQYGWVNKKYLGRIK